MRSGYLYAQNKLREKINNDKHAFNIIFQQIAKGINPNDLKDSITGNTPLHTAVKNGYDEIAAKLIRHGADPTLKNKQGQTAYAFAENIDHKNYLHVEAIQYEKTKERLSKHVSSLLKSAEKHQNQLLLAANIYDKKICLAEMPKRINDLKSKIERLEELFLTINLALQQTEVILPPFEMRALFTISITRHSIDCAIAAINMLKFDQINEAKHLLKESNNLLSKLTDEKISIATIIHKHSDSVLYLAKQCGELRDSILMSENLKTHPITEQLQLQIVKIQHAWKIVELKAQIEEQKNVLSKLEHTPSSSNINLAGMTLFIKKNNASSYLEESSDKYQPRI